MLERQSKCRQAESECRTLVVALSCTHNYMGGAFSRLSIHIWGTFYYPILWGSFDSKFDWKCHIVNFLKHSKKIGFNKNFPFVLGLWSRTLTPLQNLQSFPKENKNSQRELGCSLVSGLLKRARVSNSS